MLMSIVDVIKWPINRLVYLSSACRAKVSGVFWVEIWLCRSLRRKTLCLTREELWNGLGVEMTVDVIMYNHVLQLAI